MLQKWIFSSLLRFNQSVPSGVYNLGWISRAVKLFKGSITPALVFLKLIRDSIENIEKLKNNGRSGPVISFELLICIGYFNILNFPQF